MHNREKTNCSQAPEDTLLESIKTLPEHDRTALPGKRERVAQALNLLDSRLNRLSGRDRTAALSLLYGTLGDEILAFQAGIEKLIAMNAIANASTEDEALKAFEEFRETSRRMLSINRM